MQFPAGQAAYVGGEQEGEVQVPTDYVGKIQCFVKVVPPAADDVDQAAVQQADVLRLAVMDLHLLQCVDAGVGPAYQSVTYCSGVAAYSNTALSLSVGDSSFGTLCCKMALAQESDVAFFLLYSNMSASGTDD
jgi:hypothetical protein